MIQRCSPGLMGSSQPSRCDRGQKDIYKDSRSPPSRGIQSTRKGSICRTQLGRQVLYCSMQEMKRKVRLFSRQERHTRLVRKVKPGPLSLESGSVDVRARS